MGNKIAQWNIVPLKSLLWLFFKLACFKCTFETSCIPSILEKCNRADTPASFQDKRNIESGNVEANSDWLYELMFFTNDFIV